MFVEVKVDAIAVDATSDMPVLLLREFDGTRVVPVWIGPLEAASILYIVEGVEPPRPFTHDLLKMIIEEVGAEVLRVDVDSLEEGVFHAAIHLSTKDGMIRLVDCRPSDAVALAVRMEVPIYVREELLIEGSALSVTGEFKEHDEESLKEYLESLDPKDFGKYKM